tara:strand:+ start:346 stop:642 length:297 start_codon:yes stop_codon:yes gene_type:complete
MLKTIITQDNINKGQAKCNRECPIALSLYKNNKVAHATVYDDYSTLFLKKKINGKTIALDFFHSDQILNFIKKFDEGKKVNPQTIIFNKSLLRKKKLL